MRIIKIILHKLGLRFMFKYELKKNYSDNILKRYKKEK